MRFIWRRVLHCKWLPLVVTPDASQVTVTLLSTYNKLLYGVLCLPPSAMCRELFQCYLVVTYPIFFVCLFVVNHKVSWKIYLLKGFYLKIGK